MLKIRSLKRIPGIVKAILVFILMLLVGSSVYIYNSNQNLYQEKIDYLTEVGSKSADLIQTRVTGRLDTLQAIAFFIGNHDYEITYEHYKSTLVAESRSNSFKDMGLIMPDGTAYSTLGLVFNVGEREYFKQALLGVSTFSDILQDIVDGQEINVFSVPIYQDNQVAAVLYAAESTDSIAHMLEVQSFGTEGRSLIYKANGQPVAQVSEPANTLYTANLFEELAEDSRNQESLVKLEQDMSQGISSNVIVKRAGRSHQLCYVKMDLKDWYIITDVPTSAIFSGSQKMIFGLIFATVLVLLAATVLVAALLQVFRKNNDYLAKIAFTDRVTGCANWNKFNIDCGKVLAQHANLSYAMVIFDIDKFKVINDIYGHERGNQFLKFIARVLFENVHEPEIFSRSSSDHFSVLMVYNSEQELYERLEKINAEIQAFWQEYAVGLSFGVYLIDDYTLTANVLNDRADIARMVIKDQADRYINFFTEEDRKRILHEKDLEDRMEHALDSGEFELYLQPKYSFNTGDLVGGEALVRWNDPQNGVILPDNFIPLFERNGFIRKLDIYMFHQACHLLSDLPPHFLPASFTTISVNFSRLHLNNENLVDDLAAIAKQYGVDNKRLEIELTESIVFDNIDMLVSVMTNLKKTGFVISIDDFGSGYSSLNMLKNLPADVLKLDKAFLDVADDDTRAKQILVSLIEMAKIIGLTVVAEGVETAEQASFLRQAGCDIAQGYYYAKPMPSADFIKLVNENN